MKRLTGFLAVALLAGCASMTKTGDTTADSAQPVMRRLAWMEGDFQSNYQPDREIAESRLKDWEGKVPEMSDVDSYLDYLSVLDASGRSEGETKIKAFLAQNPKELRAVFLLGVHYLRIKKKDLANYFFAQLEKEDSFRWKSLLYNNLGMMALEEKNRVAALGYFEKATQSGPPTAAPLVNLGALYLQSRSYSDAEKLFSRALDIDGDFEDAALGLGASLEGQGKFEEAHNTYQKFIDGHSNALSLVYNDAVILGSRLKQKELALQLMQQYLQRGGRETARAHEMMQSWR